MKSNYSQAKTAEEVLLALGESLTSIEELLVVDTTTELKVSETARDGLVNIMSFFCIEALRAIDLMEEEKRALRRGEHESD